MRLNAFTATAGATKVVEVLEILFTMLVSAVFSDSGVAGKERFAAAFGGYFAEEGRAGDVVTEADRVGDDALVRRYAGSKVVVMHVAGEIVQASTRSGTVAGMTQQRLDLGIGAVVLCRLTVRQVDDEILLA